ncbi:hypothetical protein MYX82_08775 [Acidobacteria bacterium AH-259-D05]|nr:hypothetical protein [Acidobacteria bacterium AH-259-D05]
MNKRDVVVSMIAFFGAFMIVGALIYFWRGDGELPTPVGEDLAVEVQAPSSLLEFEEEYKASLEVAQWIFRNHDCQTCHTISDSGFLGLTAQGEVMAEDFQGCPGMLQTVWETVGVSEADWTDKQKQVRVEFERFGCTACHQVGPSSVELTEIGAKAAVMHMTCSSVLSTLGKVSQGGSAQN